MVESGNNDRGIGRAGEVSRVQILPSVWKAYSSSREYQNPEVTFSVASQHWNYLASYFRQRVGHEPDYFDMYVLWNTRLGYYAHHGFNPSRLDATVRGRAVRFVNLIRR
jgi:hypothetical protein